MTNLLLTLLDQAGVRPTSRQHRPDARERACRCLARSRRDARAWLVALTAVVVGCAATLASIALSALDRSPHRCGGRRPRGGEIAAGEADVAAAEADGTTAFHWAVENDNDALVAVLLEGARRRRLSTVGIATLHRAATTETRRSSRRSRRRDANFATPAGETPLMMAARGHGGHRGADRQRRRVQRVRRGAGRRPDVGGKREQRRGHPRAREELVPTSTRSASGMFTPLLFAVRGGHLDATRALLDAGADVNERLPDGMSALVLAVHNAHYELAAALLERSADLNAAAQGWSALHQSPGRASRIAASCRGRFHRDPRQPRTGAAARRARRRRERAHHQGARAATATC